MNRTTITPTHIEQLFAGARKELERSFIGADRMLDGFRNSLGAFDSYPPYNIEKIDDNKYRISIALAGFGKKDITVTKEGHWLLISGEIKNKAETAGFFYQGIATRDFTRKVQLATDLTVGEATMENGMLHIELLREIPEELKPKTIKIK